MFLTVGGKEIDTRYDQPYEYDMNNGNTAIFDPNGKILFKYRSDQDKEIGNKVLFYNLDYEHISIPLQKYNSDNFVKMLNPYYTSWTDDYITPKDLPTPNINNVAVITFKPTLDCAININLIENYYNNLPTKANISLIILKAQLRLLVVTQVLYLLMVLNKDNVKP